MSGLSGTGRTPDTGRNKGRISVAAALAAAALTLSSCATGQHAATAIDRPAIAGTGGSIGSIQLLNVAIKAPVVVGRATGTKFYTAGDNAPLTVTLVNSGHTADTLTSVTSTAFSSWAIVNSNVVNSAGAGETTQLVAAQSRIALGLTNLGASTPDSPQTLVMRGLTKANGNLYPGSIVEITFTFATAGSVTLDVPVALTGSPTTGSIAPVGADAGA